MISGSGIFGEITLRLISPDITDDKSILVQVMAGCRQVTSHNMSRCWPRSMSYGFTRPQWLKLNWFRHYDIVPTKKKSPLLCWLRMALEIGSSHQWIQLSWPCCMQKSYKMQTHIYISSKQFISYIDKNHMEAMKGHLRLVKQLPILLFRTPVSPNWKELRYLVFRM